FTYSRSMLFHRGCRGRSRLTVDDSRTVAGPQAGHGIRFHHARLQHALHLLHRAPHTRSGTQPHHFRDRLRSSRSRVTGCEGSDVTWPNRESLWPTRVPLCSRGTRPELQKEPVRAIARSPQRDRSTGTFALYLAASDRLS